MARSLEGWLTPQQGLKSSRFPSWRSHLDGRQRPLPSVSLLPVSGWPTSNPSYQGPRLSADDDRPGVRDTGHTEPASRLLSHSLPGEGPASPLPLQLTCACYGAANAPAKHLAAFGRRNGSEEFKGRLLAGLMPYL